jgi:MFS family permease
MLSAIAASQLLVLTLWFSASAVAPQLEAEWTLTSDETAGLTLAVQLGFVVGAVLSSVTGLADAIPSRRLFAMGTTLGIAANSGLVLLDAGHVSAALSLRFLTGVALAAVYPAGLKVMAGWFTLGRGMALGALVGALTIGSATPHLVRGLGLDWQGVVLAASVLAGAGGVTMAIWVTDGPHEVRSGRFSLSQVGRVIANRGVRLSTYGYLGHMWELYAMWTWTAAFFTASATAGGFSDGWASTATFAVISAGAPGSWLAGRWADRYGRTLIAGASLALSGSVALVSPLLFGLTPWAVVPMFILWGFAVVADSAQFSTMVTETASAEIRGTALTLQTAAGFLLTLVTIRGVPLIADALTWRWAFPVLALGPAGGLVAMVRLRRSDEAVLLAGGRG